MHCEKRMREMVVSFSSLLSFLLVSEATILPHYKIPVTGSALKLAPMLTLWLKHDGFQEEERAMSPATPHFFHGPWRIPSVSLHCQGMAEPFGKG
jgi:hypothetical protein